jgi:hypothetical protein
MAMAVDQKKSVKKKRKSRGIKIVAEAADEEDSTKAPNVTEGETTYNPSTGTYAPQKEPQTPPTAEASAATSERAAGPAVPSPPVEEKERSQVQYYDSMQADAEPDRRSRPPEYRQSAAGVHAGPSPPPSSPEDRKSAAGAVAGSTKQPSYTPGTVDSEERAGTDDSEEEKAPSWDRRSTGGGTRATSTQQHVRASSWSCSQCVLLLLVAVAAAAGGAWYGSARWRDDVPACCNYDPWRKHLCIRDVALCWMLACLVHRTIVFIG